MKSTTLKKQNTGTYPRLKMCGDIVAIFTTPHTAFYISGISAESFFLPVRSDALSGYIDFNGQVILENE